MHEIFTYNPNTGDITHKNTGEIASMKKGPVSGYFVIHDNKRIIAHKLAWYLYYGVWPITISHINGDKCDNRIDNLMLRINH